MEYDILTGKLGTDLDTPFDIDGNKIDVSIIKSGVFILKTNNNAPLKFIKI